jgi:hypothetical protein
MVQINQYRLVSYCVSMCVYIQTHIYVCACEKRSVVMVVEVVALLLLVVAGVLKVYGLKWRRGPKGFTVQGVTVNLTLAAAAAATFVGC